MILDPRFMLALFLGVILDILSYILMGLDAGIIAAIVNIVLGLFVVWLMVSLGKDKDQANARLGRKGLAQRRQMTSKLLGKRVSKRVLKRSLIMYVGNSIPIVNFIPFWTVGLIMMLREGSGSEQTEQVQPAPQRGTTSRPMGRSRRLRRLVRPRSTSSLRPERENKRLPEKEKRGSQADQTARQPKVSPTAARFATRAAEKTPSGRTTPLPSGSRQIGAGQRPPRNSWDLKENDLIVPDTQVEMAQNILAQNGIPSKAQEYRKREAFGSEGAVVPGEFTLTLLDPEQSNGPASFDTAEQAFEVLKGSGVVVRYGYNPEAEN